MQSGSLHFSFCRINQKICSYNDRVLIATIPQETINTLPTIIVVACVYNYIGGLIEFQIIVKISLKF